MSGKANVDALERLFVEWSATGGRLAVWEVSGIPRLPGDSAVGGGPKAKLGRQAAKSSKTAVTS